MTEHDARLRTALEANGAVLLNYFERRVGLDDAPDLLADVMLVAWRRVRVIPEDAQQARMWLFGVARNVLLDHNRTERRRSRLANRLRSVTQVTETLTAPADQHFEVLDAVAQLPTDLRELVQLVHWDGFTIAEAANHIGIRASTARSRYQRAREQLRVALLPESVIAEWTSARVDPAVPPLKSSAQSATR